jgi:hypothetical protein
LNSQQSDIDRFIRLENSFLEKFFKYNLTDYFGNLFENVFESINHKKIIDRNTKVLTASLFFAKEAFII